MINEITSTEAYQALASDPEAILIDCRTKEEWQLLGTPDLSRVGKRAVLIEWQDFQGRVNEDFCDQVEDVTDTIVLFTSFAVRAAVHAAPVKP